ncbi:hypothetical protein C6P42_001954 [Pichia californica]|nr:hypothetical protein C6P42_001954 [[Candida] californica]
MTVTTQKRKLLIGVDVGGTNSDLVVLDPSKLNNPKSCVIAWHKTVTTPDVSVGIERAIKTVLENPQNQISKDEIISVSIGTTHFINAVIERDANRLEKVAVIRLSGPYGRGFPPFGDFPEDLAQVIHGYHVYLNGGCRVDGKDIQPLDEEGLRTHVSKIKELGISSIAVVATFANINPKMELRAKEIIEEVYPECDIVLSHTISGLGFVERENATVLNASIKKFGRKIIKSFVHATKNLGLNCTVLLSQNDGTVLSVADALETPIRTFSSGATNSMRGASILCSHDPEIKNKNVMVCDVGGTTTDVGQLLASGFPRQSAVYSYVGGVKMNFSMPHVESIGLGGGSIVRYENETGKLTIGPDSTGADIINKAILFGGETITTSDVTLSKYLDSCKVEELPSSIYMGKPENVINKFSTDFKIKYTNVIQKLLEKIIDKMKTSAAPIPVIFVGGGSFIAPDYLEGASKVIKPPFYQVANAVGAALGKVSTSVSEFRTTSGLEKDRLDAIDEITERAIKDVVKKGALPSSVTVVNIVSDAVPYLENVYQFEVKVVGDVDYENSIINASDFDESAEELYVTEEVFKNVKVSKKEKVEFDYVNYVPHVEDGIWYISEADVDMIGIGSYILGCGGGGDPNSEIIELKHLLKQGKTIKVVTLDKYSEMTNGKGRATNASYCGSPTISGERLHANDLLECIELIEKLEGKKTEALCNWEIGGSNGLSGLWCACKLDLPFVDIDTLGRAYPTIWQSIASVVNNYKAYPYATLSNGNGYKITFNEVGDDFQLEDAYRDCLARQGCHGGCANPSCDIDQLRKENILDTVSLSWRIGKAVMICRKSSDLDNIPLRVIDAFGGPKAAKCLMTAKIMGVEKKLKGGYGYGIVVLEGLDEEKSNLRIPFKNENIVVTKTENDGSETVLCSVPDLITLIDTDGNAVGVQDYRYGLIVYVMVFSPAKEWSTPEAIESGGPKGFGETFEHIEYKPVGEFVPTVPVSKQYNKK